MSRLFISYIAVVLSIAGCSRQLPPGERNNYYPFGVEHAALHLEYFGDTRGTEDIYEDSCGIREAHLVHSELITSDAFHPTIVYTVRDISSVNIIDSVKHQEMHLIDKTADSLFHLPPGNVPTSEEQFASFTGQHGYILRGDTNIVVSGLSLKSHIWQAGEQQTYILEYKGLIVGRMANMNGHENDLRLMSIDTLTPIDPARFSPPHGFPLFDMTKTPLALPGSHP